MKKYLAELVGTFFLVFFGVGTAVIAGDKVGIVGIAFAFGLGLVAAAYGIGPISGCHINPAVSMGVWAAGRMKTVDLIGYWVGQFVGATLAAWVIYLIASGVGGGYNIAASGLGQNGCGPGYQGGYSLTAAIVYEFVATLLLCDRGSGLDAEDSARGLCRTGDWHGAGGHSPDWHSHYRKQREPGAQLWTGGLCGRPGYRAALGLSAGANPGWSGRGRCSSASRLWRRIKKRTSHRKTPMREHPWPAAQRMPEH